LISVSAILFVPVCTVPLFTADNNCLAQVYVVPAVEEEGLKVNVCPLHTAAGAGLVSTGKGFTATVTFWVLEHPAGVFNAYIYVTVSALPDTFTSVSLGLSIPDAGALLMPVTVFRVQVKDVPVVLDAGV
jgi:hypothetical protein